VESKLGSTRHVGHFWLIVPAPGDCEDREFGGMKIGRGYRGTRRKPTPAPLCPPQIPLYQTRARTRAFAVGSQRLTAWAMRGLTSFRKQGLQLSIASCYCRENEVGRMQPIAVLLWACATEVGKEPGFSYRTEIGLWESQKLKFQSCRWETS
jgi:hypothetical protein